MPAKSKNKKKMTTSSVPRKKSKSDATENKFGGNYEKEEDISLDDDENAVTDSVNSYDKLIDSFEKSQKKILSNFLNVGRKADDKEPFNNKFGDEMKETLSSDDDEHHSEHEEGNENEDESESDEETHSPSGSSSLKKDAFHIHFEQTIDEEVMERIEKSKQLPVDEKKKVTSSEEIHSYFYLHEIMKSLDSFVVPLQDADKMFHENVKTGLKDQWSELNIHKKKNSLLTGVQQHLFPYICSYQDLYYSNRNFQNGEEIRKLYCLHAVNHVLKSVSKVIKNNKKVELAQTNKDIDLEDCRDQGLTRPKVLIMVPFKDSCYKCVNNIIKTLLKGTKGQVMNKKRFKEEYGPPEDVKESKNKPDDFKQMFDGNIDDCFRIGLTVSKKNIKLYSHFYSSDIIIASPLGLRTIIGAESEVQDFDFLSSIEVLIIDQTDVFLMQNWEHILHVMDHMNKLPKKSRDADFSRVRMWAINNWRQYYRQTLIFSSFQTPEINSIFNRYCHNFSGKIKRSICKHHGCVRLIAAPLKQVFYKCECTTHEESADQRFQYFVDRILPMYRSGTSSNVGIFVPSYFDFVRLRNYFKREEISFVQISEYSQRANISRARNLFLEKRKSFIIFTERFYFFYRYKIRGIRTMIFYQLPQYPQFYAELVNFMETRDKCVSDSSVSCVVMFSPFDGSRLEGIVGTDRCRRMIASDKSSFMLLTES